MSNFNQNQKTDTNKFQPEADKAERMDKKQGEQATKERQGGLKGEVKSST